MKYFKKIEGKRIYLSPMNIEDIEIYTKWLNDFSVTDGIGRSTRVFTLENEREWIINNIKNGNYQFAIINKDTDEVIGNCGFENINHIRQIAELGLFIGDEENRNKGYGRETIELLIKYGFLYLNLNNIMLKVYSFNERAINCYKKCGFTEFGRRHNVIPLKNKWYDEIYMEILKVNYLVDKND